MSDRRHELYEEPDRFEDFDGNRDELVEAFLSGRYDGGPDLTNEILSRVHERRAFMSPRMRNFVRHGRHAVLAALLLGLLGITLLQREHPEILLADSEPAYVSDLVQSVSDVVAVREDLEAALRCASGRMVPAPEVDRSGETTGVLVAGRWTFVCDQGHNREEVVATLIVESATPMGTAVAGPGFKDLGFHVQRIGAFERADPLTPPARSHEMSLRGLSIFGASSFDPSVAGP